LVKVINFIYASSTNKILGMLNAGADHEWTSPSQVDQLNPINVADSSLDETVPNLSRFFIVANSR
jgi:hypothetical protein